MDNSCEISKLIYTSQTACYAKDRARALRKLGKFSCVCNPEIMSAFIYGLNDADERVREQAAEEIEDQVKKNPCCCTAAVTLALQNALGDCDKGVRRKAEKALKRCGYNVVKGCCPKPGCTTGACGTTACAPAAHVPSCNAPVNGKTMTPEPAPPVDGEAYYPARIRRTQATKSSRLAGLFGFNN